MSLLQIVANGSHNPSSKQFANATQVRRRRSSDGCSVSVLLWGLQQASEDVTDGIAKNRPLASCKDARTKERRNF
jgi:hypothetical protein